MLSRRGESWVASGLALRKVGGGAVRSSGRRAHRRRRPTLPRRPAAAPDRPNGGGCHPNYSGCLNPNATDYDCSGGGGDGPLYTGPVTVRGDDPYELDADEDGLGCEDS